MKNIKDKWLIEYGPMTSDSCFYKYILNWCCINGSPAFEKDIVKCDRETCPLRVKLKSETQTKNNK